MAQRAERTLHLETPRLTPKDRELVAQIRALQVQAGLSREAFISLLGMNRATYFRRLSEPGSFRVDELRRIRRIADSRHIPFEVSL